MEVWVVVEELAVNEEPRMVGLFSSLDECSKGIKVFVAEMYETEEEADSEIEVFNAELYTVDKNVADRRNSPELPATAVFDISGSRIH